MKYHSIVLEYLGQKVPFVSFLGAMHLHVLNGAVVQRIFGWQNLIVEMPSQCFVAAKDLLFVLILEVMHIHVLDSAVVKGIFSWQNLIAEMQSWHFVAAALLLVEHFDQPEWVEGLRDGHL